MDAPAAGFAAGHLSGSAPSTPQRAAPTLGAIMTPTSITPSPSSLEGGRFAVLSRPSLGLVFDGCGAMHAAQGAPLVHTTTASSSLALTAASSDPIGAAEAHSAFVLARANAGDAISAAEWRNTPALRDEYWLCTRCRVVMPKRESRCSRCSVDLVSLSQMAPQAENEAIERLRERSGYGARLLCLSGREQVVGEGGAVAPGSAGYADVCGAGRCV